MLELIKIYKYFCPTLDDEEFIFIFTKKQSVVSYVYFRRNDERLYFDPIIGGHTYYTPETAVFKIMEAKNSENRKLGHIELYELVRQPPNVQYFINKGW
ncbi:MAG: hypothetical protein MUE81_18965 [Thermoflexibacter sp.]|nr:hypothetical protein [Thermoflexibacter sp.]